MTREILFRGFHKDENGTETIYLNGEEIKGNWVYGYLIKGATRYVIQQSIAQYSQYEVIPDTVGQYTGLDDKNGKKIFEGDKVKILENYKDEVIFDSGCFCMKNQIFNYEFTYQCFEDIEVIGTIFDEKEVE